MKKQYRRAKGEKGMSGDDEKKRKAKEDAVREDFRKTVLEVFKYLAEARAVTIKVAGLNEKEVDEILESAWFERREEADNISKGELMAIALVRVLSR